MSNNQMPQLGAKISLISKADIRYEGRLFQVDPQDCTIALASVRSFGTEERETLYPVPAQSQVYEYILFRGSDIKDIRVVPPTPAHVDPAIVQSVPISQQPGESSGFALASAASSVLGGGGGHPLGGFGGYGAGGLGGLTRAPGPLLMQQQQQQPSELGPVGRPVGDAAPGAQERKEDLITGGGSRSTTPLLRKSPTMDQGTQATQAKSPPRDDASSHPKPIQPPDRDNRGRRNEQQMYQPRGDYQRRQPFHDNNRHDYQRNDYQQRDYQQRDRNDYQQRDRNDYQQRDRNDYQQRDRNDFQRNDFYNRRPNNNYRNNYRDGPQDNQNRGFQNRQDGWVPRNNQHMNNLQGGMGGPRGGGRGRGGGGGGQGRPNNTSSGTPQANKKNPLKFDSEYDFDKANTEFEEMRAQLNKIKITAEEQVAALEGKETEKTEDSVNEVTPADGQSDAEVFYDKKKSFFDCISCEAVERSKGRSQRTDWRTERKLNTETFGVSSARRGMYRGRGYYHGNRNYGYRPRNNVNGESQPQSDAAPAQAAPAEPLTQKVVEKPIEAKTLPPLVTVS